MTDLPEHAIQRVLLARLNALADEHGRLCWCWRANTGMARMGNRVVRFGLPGQADISGLLRTGRRLEVEVKTRTGKQTPEQAAFQAQIFQYGGLYLLARDIDSTLDAVRSATR